MDSYGDLPTPTRSYTVTFNANGGNTPSPSSKTVSYIFNGWYTAESGGTKVESTTVMNVKGGTLYARWTAPTYGTLATCTRDATSSATYTFSGWFTAASGGSKVTSSTTVNLTTNQILYAQWTTSESTYTLTWSSPLAESGRFKEGLTRQGYSNGHYKCIKYTNQEGNTEYADPYTPGSITIKKGTSVILQWENDNTLYDLCIVICTSPYTSQRNEKFVSCGWEPEASCYLSGTDESFNENVYQWYIYLNR